MPRKKTGQAVDQRSPDQDAAMEAAFVNGALPEEDRRQSAAPVDTPIETPVVREGLREVSADERGLTQVPVLQADGTKRWAYFDGAGEPVTIRST